MLLSVNGLIIRETAVNDSDKLLTLLTAEYGKITVMGKNIRNLKSRFMTATQLFCYTQFVLYQRSERYWINEAELIESFFSLRCDLESVSLANYVVDIANTLCTENSEENALLQLTLNTLFCLAQKKKPFYLLKAAYELRAATIAGYMPDLVACKDCSAYEAEKMYLDIMNGKLQCDACFHANQMQAESTDGTAQIIMPLSLSTLTAMRYTIYAKPERIFSFSVKEEASEEFSLICEKYLLNHVEHGFTTLDFYKEIQGGKK